MKIDYRLSEIIGIAIAIQLRWVICVHNYSTHVILFVWGCCFFSVVCLR